MSTIATGAEAPQPGLPHELHEPLEIIKQYAMPVAVGVGIALVAVLGISFYRGQKANAQRDALMLLSSARSLDDLERVVSDYGNSPAAPLALLKIAHGYFSSGNYALAKDKYDAFTARFPQHEFAAAALLGVWQCAEAQGRTQDALAGFREFAAANPEHFLTAQAVLGQGRCLQQLGKLTEARVVLEQYVAAHPEDAWNSSLEDLLATVNRSIAKGLDGIVPTEPATVNAAATDSAPSFALPPLAAPAAQD
ncbi:MAG: tetratricopeptide repeat protein [Lentisphaerae bacterium]|nr:tetratricopeptide repeat protein [Lentisphaerota bacterium]